MRTGQLPVASYQLRSVASCQLRVSSKKNDAAKRPRFGWKLGAGNWELEREAASNCPEAGSWELAAGSRKLVACDTITEHFYR
jgi:hypothetical protein